MKLLKISIMIAKELRIGNLVLIGGAMEEICVILSIQEKLIGYDAPSRKVECNIDWVKPIPLTEEWLIKIESTNNMQIHNGNVNIWQDVEYCDIDVRLPKYVHQLQNLYFAITGKELTFKNERQ